MMKDIRKEAKQNSLQISKSSSSGFVSYKDENVGSFKSSRVYAIMNKIRPKLQNLKRLLNKFIQKPKLLLEVFDWKKAGSDSFSWFAEAVIEGAIANWWTHKIFGLEFGFGMIVAHGFLIKQMLDLYKRIIKDGSNTKLLTKNKL
jgi:hypothetical protein